MTYSNGQKKKNKKKKKLKSMEHTMEIIKIKNNSFKISNVYYAPNIKNNLISTPSYF